MSLDFHHPEIISRPFEVYKVNFRSYGVAVYLHIVIKGGG
jgi:hypothetical protein